LEDDVSKMIETNWFENEVRARSHAIWESEGHRDGFSEENWMRAARDIEDRCRAALEGTDMHFAPPHPMISTLPVRQVTRHTAIE
jgi:hypothetical protein